MAGDRTSAQVPLWLWRALLLALTGLILGGLSGVVLLALGAADPPRAGPLQWQQEAESGECLDAAALVLPPLRSPVTVELTAVRMELAASLAVWGVWLGTPEAAGLRWEVLPPGYYRHAGQTIPFYHIGAGENTLRLDISGGHYVLWLNHERATEGAAPVDSFAWGLVGDAGICWRRLAIYGPN